jgi:hypothetical protein
VLVRRLVGAEQRPGNYTVVWDGADARARRVPNGTYFYILKSDGRVAQRRMLLVR